MKRCLTTETINLLTLTPKSYVDSTYQRTHPDPARLAQGWFRTHQRRENFKVTNCDLAVIGAQLIDVKGMYVLPGGVEIHAHGGGGRDFMECTEDAAVRSNSHEIRNHQHIPHPVLFYRTDD